MFARRPYAAYADMDFDIPLGERRYDRYLVRLEEMRQSRRIVEVLDRPARCVSKSKLPKL